MERKKKKRKRKSNLGITGSLTQNYTLVGSLISNLCLNLPKLSLMAYELHNHLFCSESKQLSVHANCFSLLIDTDMQNFIIAGFIMMCPQLFINYKLKSVAHLPWRQMTYKFLNTIIDDLFAFVIKMPTLHRLSVFRDGEI